MQVEVFSDVVCPWCYIGKRRLEQALGRFAHADDVTVTYRSFQLDPTTPVDVTGSPTERLAEKYGVSVAQARAMNQRVTDVAATVGLDFHIDIAHPANTFAAHRLLHLAAERGRQLELKERLMAAYFVRGERVGDADELVRLATEVGLDAGEARSALTDEKYAEAVRADLSLARSFGISSVPFFVLDRKYGISGAQESSVLLQALEQAWAEANPLTMVGAGDRGKRDGVSGAAAGDGATDDACADGACAV